MHLLAGGGGRTAVVFNAGWGTVHPCADFYPLLDKIEGQTRYAVIDRFGYGYSDMTERSRDIDHIAEEIRGLLQASGVKPPYVLVGHSLGSLETIRYAQNYPDEVEGIVLLDGGSPEYYAAQAPLTLVSLVQRFLVQSGAARALYHFDGFAESLASERNGLKLVPDELKELDRIATLLKANNKNVTDEMRRSRSNAKKTMAGRKPLDVPMTVITAGSFGKAPDGWLNDQAALVSWSVSGKHVVIENAEHYVHHYDPDTVAGEILALVR